MRYLSITAAVLTAAGLVGCQVETEYEAEDREGEFDCSHYDLDGDGEVGFGDFLILSGNFNGLTGDGVALDFAFFLGLNAVFGTTCTAPGGVCVVPPPPDGIDGSDCTDTCIPKQVYGKVAAQEYYNECRNYCFADDQCFNRASAMLGTLDEVCETDLRGPDGTWCDEFANPATPAPCDDLAYKVIIRYPCGEKWGYHIATVVETCEEGLCVIDPIGQPAGSPTTTCRTPQDWCTGFAHGKTVEWHDTNDQPPAGKVYCEIAPGNQDFWLDGSVTDPTDAGDLAIVCDDLQDHVDKLCAKRKHPFPVCTPDSDDDGIPDAYDKCPDTPPGTPVDFCDPANLGCAVDGGFFCGLDHYSVSADWTRVADADRDLRAVTGEVLADKLKIDLGKETLETQCEQPDAGTALSWSLPAHMDPDAVLTIEVSTEGSSQGRGLVCVGWNEAPAGCSDAGGTCTCDTTKGDLDDWLADGNRLEADIRSTDRNYNSLGQPYPAVASPPLQCKGP